MEWLLYGDVAGFQNDRFPFTDEMKAFIESHPEIRRYIWNEMNKADFSPAAEE